MPFLFSYKLIPQCEVFLLLWRCKRAHLCAETSLLYGLFKKKKIPSSTPQACEVWFNFLRNRSNTTCDTTTVATITTKYGYSTKLEQMVLQTSPPTSHESFSHCGDLCVWKALKNNSGISQNLHLPSTKVGIQVSHTFRMNMKEHATKKKGRLPPG